MLNAALYSNDSTVLNSYKIFALLVIMECYKTFMTV